MSHHWQARPLNPKNFPRVRGIPRNENAEKNQKRGAADQCFFKILREFYARPDRPCRAAILSFVAGFVNRNSALLFTRNAALLLQSLATTSCVAQDKSARASSAFRADSTKENKLFANQRSISFFPDRQGRLNSSSSNSARWRHCFARNNEIRLSKRLSECRQWGVLPAFIVIFISRREKIHGWKRLSHRIQRVLIMTGTSA